MINKILKNYFIITVIFFFPWQLFKMNFDYDMYFFVKLIVGILIILLAYYFLIFLNLFIKKIKLNSDKYIFIFSFIFFLEASVLEFENMYIRLIILSFVLLALLYFDKNNRIKEAALIFSIFFIFLTFSKGNYLFLKKYFHNPNQIYSKNLVYNASDSKKSLIIIFLDELSSLKYFNDKPIDQKKRIKKFENVFINHNFKVIDNTFSNYSETFLSIPSIVNINNELDVKKIKQNQVGNNIYNQLLRNSYFNYWKDDIYVFQDSVLNFCKDTIKNIKKCKTEKYITLLSTGDFLVINSNIKYIYDKFYYFFYFGTKKYFPELNYKLFLKRSSKYNFEKTLNSIVAIESAKQSNDILNFYFVHAITPHTPYMYQNDCKYGFVENDDLDIEERDYFHSHELECLANVFKNFFEKLQNNNVINNLEIIISSDHGNRHNNNFMSLFSTFTAYRGVKDIENDDKLISIQNLIPKLIFKNFEINTQSNNFVYDRYTNNFIEIN